MITALRKCYNLLEFKGYKYCKSISLMQYITIFKEIASKSKVFRFKAIQMK